MPITLSLNFRQSSFMVEDNELRYIDKIVWNTEKSDAFVKEISSEYFRNTMSDITHLLQSNVDDAVSRFSTIFLNAANAMKKNYLYKSK